MSVRPITSRMALSATAFTVPSGFWMLNRYLPTLSGLGSIRHSTEKSTSTMFSSPVSIRLSSGTSRTVVPRRRSSTMRMPTSILRTLQRLGRQHGLDRIREVVVQARLHLAHLLAEAHHHADLVGLDAEEPGQEPQHDGAEHQHQETAAAQIAARQHGLELVLAAAQQFFEVRRGRPGRLRSGAPGAPSILRPIPRARRPDCSTA